MVKYLNFHYSSSALRYFFNVYMARPQCDTPLVVIRDRLVLENVTLTGIISYFRLAQRGNFPIMGH